MHAHWWLNPSPISFLAPRYICTNAAQSTFSPVGSMTFSLTTFPYFEKTSVLVTGSAPLASVGFVGTLRWEQHEAGSPGFQVEVLKAKFTGMKMNHWWNENVVKWACCFIFIPSIFIPKFNHHWWNENENNICSQKKNPKKERTVKNRCQKKRKLRSWLVKPTSQQKAHRSSGSFDVDVVAQVFNVVHFLMLHAQVVGSRIVDSRIGPCLKWPTIWLFNMAMQNPHFS